MFKKILVANRGEIAVRVMRSAREMGIKTVAVYSDADRDAFHVKYADEAYYIGKSPSAESYLNMDKIIEVAKKSGAEAIHPGYGFLSENAEFSQRCKEVGIVFIGPEPYAITTMGDKITARKTMEKAGVPVVPGATIEDESKLFETAEKIGFPIMIKASAGGGGKGMRLVHSKEELSEAYRLAKAEAKAAFGDDTVYIEKYITSPHHIEFQILADKHGNVIHINERECSVQRRHQKIIEETPSPLMTPELRKKMGETAVQAAKSVNYVGAGTVEFLVSDNREFYFLEMNTRLQVEHPITEMTTGYDLVKEQIKIAYGLPLEIKQQDVPQLGHAIECRIYAEDPDNNFMPAPGKVAFIKHPEGIGVRVDGYVYRGFEIPIYYDPMIAKVITWGKDRNEAINRMIRALSEYRIAGIKNNVSFLIKVLKHPKFREGKYDTRFVGLYIDQLKTKTEFDEKLLDISAIVVYLDYIERSQKNMKRTDIAETSQWKIAGRMRAMRGLD